MRNSSVSNSMITNIPSLTWQRRSIESLCLRITSGGTPSRQNPDFYKDGTIRWIKTKELKDWYIDDSEEKITIDALNKSSAKLFPVNTILMAMYGDGRTITSLGILRKESASNQACCAMIVNPEICNHLFLFYSLKFHRNDFIHLASGASQRNLNAQTIRNFEIKVPPLHVQNKIVSILSAYDDLIENNNRRIKILESMAQLLYREWFVNFRFPGHQQVPMVESELGLIPQGWEVVKIGDIADVGRGSSPRPIADTKYFEGGTIPWIKIADATKSGKFLYDTKEKVNEYGASFSRLMPKGSIIVAASGTLGYTQILGVDGCIHDGWLYLTNYKGIKQEYLYFVLLEKQQFFYNSAYGAAIQNVNTTILREMELLLPSASIQSQFAEVISNIDGLIDSLGRKNLNLRKTRDLLLPKLISGEIDVESLNSVTETDLEELAA